MKNSGIAILVVLAVVVILGIFGVSSYNGLIRSRATVDEYSANIDTQLQRRADLVPNLVETVKAYSKHEEAVYTSIAQARQSLINAINSDDMAKKTEANENLTTSINSLLALAEAYPELKASELYVNLMDELEGCENRISKARTDYNSAAKEYNTKIRTIPTNFFANLAHMDAVDYFEAAEGSQTVPTVKFD
jgi:LemA protein